MATPPDDGPVSRGAREGARIFADLRALPQEPVERRARLGNLRRWIAEIWLSLPPEACGKLLEGQLWQATLVATVLLWNEGLLSAEEAMLAKVKESLAKAPSDQTVCAALPFLPRLGEDAGLLFPSASGPLKQNLLPLLMYRGMDTGERDQEEECRRLEALTDHILEWLPNLTGLERERFLAELKSVYSTDAFYFLEWDIPRVAAKRAQLLHAVYDWPGLHANWNPGPIPKGRRIRVGILARSFDARSETFALLPVFDQLDRTRFETILIALDVKQTQTESYCASRADQARVLSKDLPSMVSEVRAMDLDILLFGNNLSVGLALFDAPLALHRLARVQVNFVCSPITSAFPTMDYFLQGEGSEAEEGAASRYTERLVRLPGSGFCFGFEGRDESPARVWKRAHLGLQPQDLVFVSGANYFKLTPGIRQAWSRILAAVPDSLLLMYPFGPAWSKEYPQQKFVDSMLENFESQGVARDRLVVVAAMKNVQEIRSLLRCADVYLDAFPYSGATSLQDPLDVGLPMVVLEGRELRFRQGAALLREAGLDLLVASDPEAYHNLAVRLGRDAPFRTKTAHAVRTVMAGTPPFRDRRAYAEKVATAFEGLVVEWNHQHSLAGSGG